MPEDKVVNTLVQPYDEPFFRGQEVLTRARIVDPQKPHSEAKPGDKVLLVLRQADWKSVVHSTGPVRILQAAVSADLSQQVLLDCTGLETVIVANCVTRQDECVKVAEFFSGGFAGWSHAVYVLHANNMPITMSWTIDNDAACGDMLRYHYEDWIEITSRAELEPACAAEHVHVCADINTSWWLDIFCRRPIDIACISAPCQPWSAAGGENGLATVDGQLMLRMADIMGVFKVPFVVMEQVANFCKHVHFPLVLAAWSEAGCDDVARLLKPFGRLARATCQIPDCPDIHGLTSLATSSSLRQFCSKGSTGLTVMAQLVPSYTEGDGTATGRPQPRCSSTLNPKP